MPLINMMFYVGREASKVFFFKKKMFFFNDSAIFLGSMIFFVHSVEWNFLCFVSAMEEDFYGDVRGATTAGREMEVSIGRSRFSGMILEFQFMFIDKFVRRKCWLGFLGRFLYFSIMTFCW